MDLSSRTVALVTMEKNSCVDATKITVSDKIRDRHQIAVGITKELRSWYAQMLPDVMYIEEPVVAGARNIRSSLLIAQIAGVVLSVTEGMDRVYFVPVSSWKRATHGSGAADKASVASWLSIYHPDVSHWCTDQDLVDAACVAFYGLHIERNNQAMGAAW